MANIKSQKKRNKTNEQARLRNRSARNELKTLSRQVHDAAVQGDTDKAKGSMIAASKMLDKAASKGIIHKNQAANRKSGLAKLVNSLN
ncbi:MAG: 30S ribosomal protein S20 [Coriobacteriales bacterium]|nr:30S ribosomal protein S20 [Coriobacteriales bacterium]